MNKATVSGEHVRMVADVYDDCIAYLDRQLGDLLEDLKVRGVLKDTLVILTSDHGEHMGDHLLFFHGCSLYRQLVHVPLVIVEPDVVPADRMIVEPVSLRDLPATVVDLLGSRREAPFPGESLARYWKRSDRAESPQVEPLLMETGKPLFLTNQGREPAARGPMKALIAGGLHYIRSGDGSEELYNLGSDRKEQTNLAALPGAATTLQSFRAALDWMLNKHPSSQGRAGGPLASSPR